MLLAHRRQRAGVPPPELSRRRLFTALRRESAARLLRLTDARIEDRRDLLLYVVRTSLICSGLAVAFDVANQLIFFDGWHNAVRSWTVSAAVAAIIAIPVSWGVGRAYLDLYAAKLIVERLSRVDSLTGLLNRRAFLEAAATGDIASLAIIDVDRFKRINDTYGHLSGDEVLRAVSCAIESELGDLGHVGRIGGEEFALVSPDEPADVILDRVKRLSRVMSETSICAGGVAVNVTLSAGVAATMPGQTFEQLYGEADRALYAAKTSGRNRVVLAAAPFDGCKGDGDNLRCRSGIVSAA